MKGKIGERQNAGQMQEVVPSQRYNAHLVPEDGSLTCSEPGVCEYRTARQRHISDFKLIPLSHYRAIPNQTVLAWVFSFHIAFFSWFQQL